MTSFRLFTALTLVSICFLSSAQSAPDEETLSLTTRFNGGSAGGGIFFNLTAKDKPLLVTHFDLNFRADGVVDVYTKSDTHVGFEQTSSAWKQLGSRSLSGDPGEATRLEIKDFVVPANKTVGVYMHSPGASGFAYNIGVALGETFSNDQLTLFSLTSHSEGDAFGGFLFSPRTWNGTVFYEVYEESDCYTLKTQSGAVSVICL